ncbi:enoyl-CoA hydratase/isomerase family protein [Bosea sp. (in: a-proteobacteria)]|uniref:enoyl-CoA hydratase/isomerase family protein n=1 Tax=Bosea sp. (in: a-proteobacteria) TaxID=1871050 RepID=UPI002625F410|nr:enoyl-CoA hydratase/isomerase family protein [Bosea sp. (in: a-proteobacteria)]MCO5090380.1 enoyl-CoA hydratase/isomerase family protein [Bosea sp. (in: a-proteobacteria)]
MAESDASPVLLTIEDGLATVVLNRPNQLNAINRAMRAAFREAFQRIEADQSVKCAMITGAGPRAFSTGADLKEIGNRTPMQRREVAAEEPSAVVRAFPKPVIAAIRGYAFGGGLEIALACDLRVAADNAVFCFPEITHGWFPAAGGTQALPRLVGMGKAMEMILTGRRMAAPEALASGLVNAVFADAEFEAGARTLAADIARHRLGALVLAKAALRMAERAGSDIGLLYEKELGALSYTLEGRAEALSAFAGRNQGRGSKAGP